MTTVMTNHNNLLRVSQILCIDLFSHISLIFSLNNERVKLRSL